MGSVIFLDSWGHCDRKLNEKKCISSLKNHLIGQNGLVVMSFDSIKMFWERRGKTTARRETGLVPW